MLYRMFIYKSTASTETALAVQIVNLAVSRNSEFQWSGNEAAHFMDHFDAESVRNEIEEKLGSKCKATVCLPPKKWEKKEYLFIRTSYRLAREVLPAVHAVATENQLVLFDAETGRTFFGRSFDNAFITLKLREQELVGEIRKAMAPVWKIRKISSHTDAWAPNTCYAVTLGKNREKSFHDRAVEFHKCLRDSLLKAEKLVCNDKSFSVSGNGYAVTFVLEGYKKHANMIGYMEGVPTCNLSRRMSVEEAFNWMKSCSAAEQNDTLDRMYFREMEDKFPNPAERLINSVRITKWLRKRNYRVRYEGLDRGGEIQFHVVPYEDEKDRKSFSGLSMDEECASYILPFVQEFYPINERYYLFDNHVPAEMWKKILDRIREAKELVLNNPYSDELGKHMMEFDLYAFKEPSACIWESGKRCDPADFVSEHRFDIASLYDVFILWSEVQLEYYGARGDGCMFNIKGP